jgi:hypothetical protein
MPTYTQAQLVREVTKRVFPRDLIEASVYVTGDLTASVVTLQELRATRASSDMYAGGYLYVYAGTDLGDWRRIETYENAKGANYGAVDLARPLTATPDGTSQVLIYNGGRSPGDLKVDINRALRRTWRQRTLPVTLVADGSMEAADTASWAAASAVLSKVTDASSVFEGARALRVVNAGANGYAQSGVFYASAQEPVSVEAVCRLNNASTAKLALVDSNTNTEIASVTTASFDRVRLAVRSQSPLDTSALVVRLIGVQSNADVSWDDVVVWRPRDATVALPSDITSASNVLEFYRRRTRTGIGPNNVAEPYSAELLSTVPDQVGPDPAAPGLVAATFPYGAAQQFPLLVKCLVPQPELTSDTDTALIPNIEDFLARVEAVVYDILAREGPHDDRSYYRNMAQATRPGAVRASGWAGSRNRNIVRGGR